MRVSLDQAAAFAIRRHHLGFSDETPQLASEVARDVLGFHAQILNSALMSAAVRIPGYTRASLEDELYRSRSLVKVWCMRGTLHLLSSPDYPLFLSAVMRPRASQYAAFLAKCGLTSSQIEELPDQVRAALSGGPLTRKELHARVPELARLPAAAWGEDVKDLGYLGVLVHADPRGNEARFGLASEWLDGRLSTGDDMPSQEEAAAELLRRYLKAYGPSSTSDVAYWAGFDRVAPAVNALNRLGDEVAAVEVEGYRNPLTVLASDLQELSALEPSPAVFALPRFDPIMMGYRDRRRFIEERWRREIVMPGGFVAATMWSQGRIVGTWDYGVSGKRLMVRMRPFRRLTAHEQGEIESAFEPFRTALGVSEVHVAF